MFTPKRPDPPHLTTSKKAPEGVPVQRIGHRAPRPEAPAEDAGEGTARGGVRVEDSGARRYHER